MGLFGSSKPATSDPAGTSPLDGSLANATDVKQQIQSQITQELAVVNATELVNKITENCFDKCIDQPYSSITSQQDQCIDQCLQKYMRSWNLISKTYVNRLQNQR